MVLSLLKLEGAHCHNPQVGYKSAYFPVIKGVVYKRSDGLRSHFKDISVLVKMSNSALIFRDHSLLALPMIRYLILLAFNCWLFSTETLN